MFLDSLNDDVLSWEEREEKNRIAEEMTVRSFSYCAEQKEKEEKGE